jgi:transposase InsO family protein
MQLQGSFSIACRYDMIVGRDICLEMGIIINFQDHVMTWDDAVVPMKTYPNKPSSLNEPSMLAQIVLNHMESDLEEHDNYVSEILPSQYAKQDVKAIAQAQEHLSHQQRDDLQALLLEFPTLFDGKLKKFKGPKVHLEIDPTAKPHRSRAYPVAHKLQPVFKDELQRLVQEDVLERAGRSEWIAGTFIIPKKEGTVRWISDFRGLNKAIKRKVYPLPRIADVLRKRRGYKFLTKLDLSMMYYTFELDDESKEYCTIATPFGLYRYKRLPMGVSQSPDIAQEIIETVLSDLMDELEVYIDDIAAFSDDWNEHMLLLRKLLTLLQHHGFTINPAKCEWAVQETEFLGHWLTPEGIKPLQKKVRGILDMQVPRNTKELRSFLGLVTYYRDMWPRRSHILTPLTDLIGKRGYHWDDRCQQAFERMKALVATDALLTYPDHNKPFDIETDASDYQLGAVIKQDGRPVAYYSRKLNSAQKNYTTIEKELLSIVETVKEFRSMLLGSRLNIYTDHRNLSHQLTAYTTQRVIRWRLLLDEFDCSFFYKQGAANVVADALSRVPTTRTERERRHAAHQDLKTNVHFKPTIIIDELEDSHFACITDTSLSLAECLLEYPVFDEQDVIRHPFHFATLRHYQSQSEATQQLLQHPNLYSLEKFGDIDLVCYKQPNQDPKIVLSDYMLPRLVQWYHLSGAHAEGMDRLEATIRRHFFHPRLREEVRKQVSQCKTCQLMKRYTTNFGELAPRNALAFPWQEVHVDLIGPWVIERNSLKYSFIALTAIDPVTNLVELCVVLDKSSATVAQAFDNLWLSRYPRPLRCIHDRGPEFIGFEFQQLLLEAGVISRPTTGRNPQSNGIIKQVHQTIGNVCRVLVQQTNPTTLDQVKQLANNALHTAMHATRCASHNSLDNISPGALVYRRDMYLDIPLLADVLTLQQLRQKQIDKRLLRSNARRKQHDYKIGDHVLIQRSLDASSKMEPTYKGPFPIVQVHTNGTVSVQLKPNLVDRYNIRRITPYRST